MLGGYMRSWAQGATQRTGNWKEEIILWDGVPEVTLQLRSYGGGTHREPGKALAELLAASANEVAVANGNWSF